MKCYNCESTSTIEDGKRWVCAEHITPCQCASDHSRTERFGGNFNVGNGNAERTKLEAMFYHTRDTKHISFLENNQLYAGLRTINTFKAGKLIIDTGYIVKKGTSFNRGRTISSLEKAKDE